MVLRKRAGALIDSPIRLNWDTIVVGQAAGSKHQNKEMNEKVMAPAAVPSVDEMHPQQR